MQQKALELQEQLLSISEELGDLSMEVLREALEQGEGTRPAADKKLAQARRAVDKAANVLGNLSESLES